MFIDVIMIGILILANGFFAAAEMAMVTTRRTRLNMLTERGRLDGNQGIGYTRLDGRTNVNISFDVEMLPLGAIRI